MALALRLPGDYLPLEGLGVTDQQESVAGLSGHSLLTAFPYKCGSIERGPMERGGGPVRGKAIAAALVVGRKKGGKQPPSGDAAMAFSEAWQWRLPFWAARPSQKGKYLFSYRPWQSTDSGIWQ